MLKKTTLSSESTRSARKLVLARESIRHLPCNEFGHIAGVISDVQTICSGPFCGANDDT